MSDLPPLTAIRVFEAAARHENFSRAAEELAMSQAAVSYQMKVLEERLGVALFARHARGMTLTDLGRRIAPQVTAAFQTGRSCLSRPHGPSRPPGWPAGWATSICLTHV
jgi:LysR family glycine cleavage system transcriptional activator